MRLKMDPTTTDSTDASGMLLTEQEQDLSTERAEERLERRSLVLWRQPLQTLKYGTMEAVELLLSFANRLLNKWLLGSLLALGIVCILPGPHESFVSLGLQNLGFALYWLLLGVLSSVGFGTGLHTFLLYLGPHIAAVTLAAYECQTLKFPEPPYPDEKVCPKEPYTREVPDIWSILSKVRPEALLWGIGTAIGELPPYFMARSARLSSNELDGAEVEQPQELELQKTKRHRNTSMEHFNVLDGAKLCMERMVRRVGFLGILLCASVPNPLFDLAGITCGHFLVPFWKFFVATMIGKVLIKATIQQVCVIVSFSDHLVNGLANGLGRLPWLGTHLQTLFKDFLMSTKQHMHRKSNGQGEGHDSSATSPSLSFVMHAFELCAVVMVAYFVVATLNALAQIHLKRRQEKQRHMRNIELILYSDQEEGASHKTLV
ncbi:vacuole membrane protein 1 [Drosophila obscura]|uniref:vacuole membrane protein 1 n=1 Tax=Drosophila obscura TaxID=7282 RepID=UPI001BB21EC3|nr:vacuole membrane protein 1 [Drosophila obscura]